MIWGKKEEKSLEARLREAGINYGNPLGSNYEEFELSGAGQSREAADARLVERATELKAAYVGSPVYSRSNGWDKVKVKAYRDVGKPDSPQAA